MAREDSEGNIWSQDKKATDKEVSDFHANDDLNVSKDSHHHTLGPGINQAAPGNHDHRGDDSAFLFEGRTITGSRTNGTAVQSIIALLVELGAADSSSA